MVVLTLLWVISVPLSVHMTNPVFENCIHFPLSLPLVTQVYMLQGTNTLTKSCLHRIWLFLVSTETMFTLIVFYTVNSYQLTMKLCTMAPIHSLNSYNHSFFLKGRGCQAKSEVGWNWDGINVCQNNRPLFPIYICLWYSPCKCCPWKQGYFWQQGLYEQSLLQRDTAFPRPLAERNLAKHVANWLLVAHLDWET